MARVCRLGAAALIAGLISSGMLFGTDRVEAAGKKGGDSQAAVCAYLLSVISYEGVSPYVKLWATSLYNSMGCQPPRS